MEPKLKVCSLSMAIAALLLPTGATLAQTRATAIEEVVVTATRRTETDVQTTPVAVTPLSGDDVSLLVPRDLGDISYSVPNFSAGNPAGFKAASFAMRGVGQTSIIVYNDPQVGVTLDDFVVPHIQTQNLEMLDVERIEVLRGPQGTLFGKNTTGGVVNVRTKRPDLDSREVEVQGLIAEYGTYEGNFTFNMPLTETIAVRGTGLYLKSDGYYENNAEYGPIFTFCAVPTGCGAANVGDPVDIPGITGTTGEGDGDDLGGDDVFSGRFKALWEPLENLTAVFTFEYVKDEGDSPPSVNETPPNTPYLWNAFGTTRDPGSPRIDRAGITNRDDLLLKMSDGHQIDIKGYYLHLDWGLTDDLTLYSVTGYRDQNSRLPSTYVGEVGPNSLFDATRDDDRNTFQQEIRLASTFDGPLNFVTGAFYQTDETTFTVLQVLGLQDLLGIGLAAFGDPNFFDNNPQVLSNEQDMDAWAVYGDVTYEVNDKLSLSGGLRYTWEQKDWKGRNQVFIQQLPDQAGFDPNFTWRELGEPLAAANFGRFSDGVVTDTESWTEPTWRAVAGYQFTDDVYSYLSYSRGFKSGGYNDQVGTTGQPIEPLQKAPVDPEKADSFELGVRSELFDRQLRLNATAFYVKYDDSQQQLVATVTNEAGVELQETRFFNAAEVDVWGLELESTWAVTDNFTLRGNLGYLDAEFDEFTADTDFDGVDDVDFSDNDVTRAPEWTGGLDAIYFLPFWQGELTFYGNVSYEDESVFVYTNIPGTPNGELDDRTLLNASITYTAPDDRWFVRLFGKNLTDEEYRTGELPVATLWVMTNYGPPRTYGAEAGIKFSW